MKDTYEIKATSDGYVDNNYTYSYINCVDTDSNINNYVNAFIHSLLVKGFSPTVIYNGFSNGMCTLEDSHGVKQEDIREY